MSSYTFSNLSPIEFEELSRDLLQKKFNTFIESFKSGRDKGIDLRFAWTKDKKCIIQCKRYESYESLLPTLKKELAKVKKLNPKRYILATSAGLNPSNKDEILTLFMPYILSTEDIFGNNDINDLLGIYPKIEQQHFKLWFSSTAVFDQILNAKVLSRSTFTKQEIEENVNVYVSTKSYPEATEILEKNKYVIISGIPGIGKTTLARMLSLHYLSKEFSFIDVSFDIDEAHEHIGKDEKQIFYYDDFLGRNFLEEGLHKNEDRRLVNFIKRVKALKSKLLIMTTREYILSQAKQKYEVLNDGELDIAKCIVDLTKYNKISRAKILYNHLFFSELPTEYSAQILIDNKYHQIINHPNYSPRLIQLMTKKELIDKVTPDKYIDEFISNLDNPHRIWKTAFYGQISERCRTALFVVSLCVDQISERNLFTCLIPLFSNKNSPFTQREFFEILFELESCFIRIHRDRSGNRWVSLANPSIYDFLIHELSKDDKLLELFIKNSQFMNQLLDIFKINPERKTDEEKIILNERLLLVLEIKISEDFELLNDLEKEWGEPKIRLERIEQLSSVFDLEKFVKIRNLCTKKLNEIDIDGLDIREREAYVKLLDNIKAFALPINRDYLLDTFFKKIINSRAAVCFTALALVFPEEYFDYLHEQIKVKDTMKDKIIAVVENDIHSSFSGVREISNLVEYIEELALEFDIDFDAEKERLEEIREAIEAEEEDDEGWRQESHMDLKIELAENEDLEVDNIFESLHSLNADKNT